MNYLAVPGLKPSASHTRVMKLLLKYIPSLHVTLLSLIGVGGFEPYRCMLGREDGVGGGGEMLLPTLLWGLLVLGIESGLASCKVSTLTLLLSLWPKAFLEA